MDELPRFGHPVEDDVHLGGSPTRHPNDGRPGRNGSMFNESKEMKKLHRDEVKEFFEEKGRRLEQDPESGLYHEPPGQF